MESEIKELKSKLETANALLTCCCGNLVDDHGIGDGHSPVDQYHYAMMQLEEQNKILQDALKWYANPEVYKPHPHGMGFDNRDLSFFAKSKLIEAGFIE